MNAFLNKSWFLAAAVAAAPLAQADPPKAAPAKPLPARSVFVMPTSPREGRDPFYPESTRAYEENAPKLGNNPGLSKPLFVKGISFEGGHAMVIINNHTFALGDEGDVLTTGGRAHLRLLEIRKDVVVVEENGSRHELNIIKK